MSRLRKKVNLVEPIDVEKIPIRRDVFLKSAYVIEPPLIPNRIMYGEPFLNKNGNQVFICGKERLSSSVTSYCL